MCVADFTLLHLALGLCRRLFAVDARVQFVQAKLGVSTGWGGAGRLASLVGRIGLALFHTHSV